MIELPEARTLARQLNEKISGKTVVKALANASEHKFAFYYEDPEDYDRAVRGKVFGQVRSFGNYVEAKIEDRLLVISEGVNARYLEPGAKIPAKHQLLLTFDDDSALVCSVQMYGLLWICPQAPLDNIYYRAALEKPDPLSAAFSENWFADIVAAAKPNLSAKALLATEQRIPGLGNGCLQDILFNARLHPKTKVGKISDAQLADLYRELRATLGQMTSQGGRDTEKDLYGQLGGYQSILSKNTFAGPCPVCAQPIQREAYLGGKIYYCPNCQRLELK